MEDKHANLMPIICGIALALDLLLKIQKLNNADKFVRMIIAQKFYSQKFQRVQRNLFVGHHF